MFKNVKYISCPFQLVVEKIVQENLPDGGCKFLICDEAGRTHFVEAGSMFMEEDQGRYSDPVPIYENA
jgi:hypothetical protein